MEFNGKGFTTIAVITHKTFQDQAIKPIVHIFSTADPYKRGLDLVSVLM